MLTPCQTTRFTVFVCDTQSERVLSCLVKVAYFAGVHMDRIEDPDVVQSNPDCGLLP
jgi:hypothetical protein